MLLKLLDYGRPKPFGEIVGKPRNLAWPVHAYRVTFPKMPEVGDGLNPFERLILKIIDAGGAREAKPLSYETCLPVDLVQCVLLRLQDKGFIDEQNEIVSEQCDVWNNTEKEPPDFITAIFFRELATGKILPFHHRLDDNNLLIKKEGDVKNFRIIRENDAHKDRPPTHHDVISALRVIKKRSVTFGNNNRLPAVQQITIAHEPEQYFLDCPIAVQKTDGEFRIAEPFGNGFSLILENAFNRLLEQDNKLSIWLMEWRKNLSNPKQDKEVATPKEPYDNATNWGRYRKLVSSLRLSRNTQHRSIEQIYAALEWAIFYACIERQFENVVKLLRLTKQEDHPDLLALAAEKIGLNLPQHGLRSVLEGKLTAFHSGKAELGTVLGIALLMAENDASHPFRRIADKYPDFINRIFDIKKKRDEQGHGKGKAQNKERELPEDAFMRDIVSTLLPTILFSDTPRVDTDKDAVADSLLDARTSIQNEFDFELFNRLGMDLQNRLIFAECFWLSCKDSDNALAFACDLYATLQAVFTRRLNTRSPEIQDSTLIAMAAHNAASAGLGKLPDTLGKVKPTGVQKTLQGEDQSLGACVLAFLLVSDDDDLRSIADTQPSFLSDVSDIIKLRDHGNEPLPLPKADIGKLRKSTYSTIKTLLDT